MWLFLASIACHKIEAQLLVKFSASCSYNRETFLSVDNGDQLLKPIFKNITYVRVKPGKHTFKVIHPWCTFYPVDFTSYEDNSFKAYVNNTAVTKYPIQIRHTQLVDKEDPFYMFKQMGWSSLSVLIFPIGMILMKKFLCNPEKMEALQQQMLEQQQLLQQQQEEAKRQNKK